MLTQQEAVAACLQLPNVYEDYPFHDTTAAMRHKGNDKVFALIMDRGDRIWMNVKAEPEWGAFWRQTYDAVVPAYHMNKQHWVSIILDGSMTDDQIFQLIAESHALTAPKLRKRK